MKRRQFLGLLGSAVAWPLGAGAQPGERVRRIGVFMSLAAGDVEAQARLAAFVRGLRELGWEDGRNIQIDVRWGAGNRERIRQDAAELVTRGTDVILASGGTAAGPVLQATRIVPIVFTLVTDPVGGGFVESLARPGGNATGFTNFEFGMSAKWLELLKEAAPRLTRAAVLRDATNPLNIGLFGAIQSVAPSFGMELIPVDLRDGDEIDRAVSAFALGANGGLIILTNALSIVHRDLIVGLAARHKLPAVYARRFFVTAGGLISYGPDSIDPHRRAAAYVDRILKGARPADLPVQEPTKFELVINLNTAKALGLEIPATLLARADEVIE